MTILVTGAAGFIGMHVAQALLLRGDDVLGVDNLADTGDLALKNARLSVLEQHSRFQFRRVDIADRSAVAHIFEAHPDVDNIVHLAARAGVRRSMEDPYAYATANMMGHLVMMEAYRTRADRIGHLVYASSSSVYGGNTKLPFSVGDRVDAPVSLYAATKRADELMSACYASLYGVPVTGLRFFTVYGPWGRPDMAVWLFSEAILDHRPIRVVRQHVERDFTYIDDIVSGVLAALDRPPERGAHALYNLGNTRRESLTRLIETIEAACGATAVKHWIDMPPGDMLATWADIANSRKDLSYEPKTSLQDGITNFVHWLINWKSNKFFL